MSINKMDMITLYCNIFPANLVLKDTIERIHVGQEYGDIERGVFIVRGENVVLLGEVVSLLTYLGPPVFRNVLGKYRLSPGSVSCLSLDTSPRLSCSLGKSFSRCFLDDLFSSLPRKGLMHCCFSVS